MNKSQKNIGKIRRGPKLEGCTFANFGNSSRTELEFHFNLWANKIL